MTDYCCCILGLPEKPNVCVQEVSVTGQRPLKANHLSPILSNSCEANLQVHGVIKDDPEPTFKNLALGEAMAQRAMVSTLWQISTPWGHGLSSRYMKQISPQVAILLLRELIRN